MNTYILLGCGFWQLSRLPEMGGYQVDKDDGEIKSTVDYLVKVNGLPNRYFQPLETVRKYRYYCESCKRWVKEKEVELGVGCIVLKEHKVVMEYKDVPIWETGAVDRYSLPRQAWMNPCFRILLSHEKGILKWQEIWRYIDGTLPLTVNRRDRMPVAVGDKMQWTLMENEVPVIDLPYKKEEDTDPEPPVYVNKWTKTEFKRMVEVTEPGEAKAPAASVTDNDGMIECQICGKAVKGKRGLFAHMLSAHKINIAKEEDHSDTE